MSKTTIVENNDLYMLRKLLTESLEPKVKYDILVYSDARNHEQALEIMHWEALEASKKNIMEANRILEKYKNTGE